MALRSWDRDRGEFELCWIDGGAGNADNENVDEPAELGETIVGVCINCRGVRGVPVIFCVCMLGRLIVGGEALDVRRGEGDRRSDGGGASSKLGIGPRACALFEKVRPRDASLDV